MPANIITAQRFEEGLTYQEYFNQLGDTRPRFIENEPAFRLASDDARFFRDTVKRLGGVKVVAIVEDWCPDVHRGLPIMAGIADTSRMEMRVFPRDKNLDIMNLYLNQGKYMSIPVFAFLDKNLNPLCHWIERPKSATQFMEKIAAELATAKLGEEELRQERRKRSHAEADNWRLATVKELRELLSKVQPAQK